MPSREHTLASPSLLPQLQKRIRDYYEYMWTMHKSTGSEAVLKDLHASLRCALSLAVIYLHCG